MSWKEQVGPTLQQVAGGEVRPYLSRDWGREVLDAGLSVIVPESKSRRLLQTLRAQLPSGVVAYVGTTRWFCKPKPRGVEIAVGPGSTQFDILRLAQTDAVNYDLDTEDLIRYLQRFDQEIGISIYQASADSVGFDLKAPPSDLHKLARELYEFCPDLIDQGWETLPRLEEVIRTQSAVELWWD